MDKDLTKAYSSIYESSLSAGEGPDRTMGTDGVARSKQQVANMFNKNIPAKNPTTNKVDKVTRKAINTSAGDLGISGPTTVKASHEPEGEMVDEMKAPRMQKGAMAYDGPNKERSEAADRVLEKTKKKKPKVGSVIGTTKDGTKVKYAGSGKTVKKEESDYNYVNSYLSELSKKTMGSYITKGSKDLADRRFDQGDSEKRKYEPDEADEKEDKKLDKREQGIARAAKKMAKEETINELKSRTMLNYIDKASDSASKELNKAKKAESKGKFKKAGKARLKMDKRESGIEMAKDKIMKKVKEGKFRSEWEEIKLNEMNDHRDKFDVWIDGIVKEGYDIERWSDEELIDTFIDENNLWKSRDAVESALLESDKKGKGSGKKDACYKKVKASASVWPSAYASGRLVQCRKKGAANYGNSTKKEGFSDWRGELDIDEALATTAVVAGAAVNRNRKLTGLTVKNTGNKSAV